MTANDNRQELLPAIDLAIAGQALTIRQAHRKSGKSYAEFVGHAGNGKHVLVRKLISGMYRARWSNPIRVERAAIITVHRNMAHA